MQNKKNTTFLVLLRLFFALELTKKWFKASFETYIQGGGGGGGGGVGGGGGGGG